MNKIKRKTAQLSLSMLFAAISCVMAYKLYQHGRNFETHTEYVNETPVSIIKPKNLAEGLVFIAHGFAGSGTIMKPIALALAEAGYTTIRFDFRGHGKHPLPYSGDITSIDGATKLFLDDTSAIITHYLENTKFSKAILIGHSMASDIIFRAAKINGAVIGAIGISSYTNAITENEPKNILIINGEREKRLRQKAISTLNEIGILSPLENKIYGSFEKGTAKKAGIIENVGHFGILYSRQTQEEISDWISMIYGNNLSAVENYLGLFLMIFLGSSVLCFIFFTSYLPSQPSERIEISYRKLLLANLSAGFLSPVFLNFFMVEFVIFPAHNYLINHLILYSFVMAIFLPFYKTKIAFRADSILIFLSLLIFYLLLVGGIINDFISTFFLTSARFEVFIFLLLGCIPIMLIIHLTHNSKRHGFFMGNTTKLFLLASMASAIILNFEKFFLLGYAIFLCICFFSLFGFFGNLLAKKIQSVFWVGLASGITLSWTFTTALPIYVP